jgi:hypothetical protein
MLHRLLLNPPGEIQGLLGETKEGYGLKGLRDNPSPSAIKSGFPSVSPEFPFQPPGTARNAGFRGV